MLPSGEVEVTLETAKKIEFYLIQNGYVDPKRTILSTYHEAAKTETLAPLPEDLQPYASEIFNLIDSVFSDASIPVPEDGRRTKPNRLNDNFSKKEFKELWARINKKATYTVQFDSAELIKKCIQTIDKELLVTPLQYMIQAGEQKEDLSYDEMASGDSFTVQSTTTEENRRSVHSAVKYDLIGKLAESVQLTRRTVSEILIGLEKPIFAQFKTNPESFISEASRLINEQKATVIIEHLSYDTVAETHDIDIFTEGQSKQDFSNAGDPLKRHIYDYVITDSKIERTFVSELDTSTEVVVYAKLPRGFFIPTPVGTYNPDWAISFKEGAVKHVYFVAETKGTMSTMELKKIEEIKIDCARKFFDEINRKIDPKNVKYDVVKSYEKLMEIVGVTAS